MNKFIVITTINPPSKAIAEFSRLSDWHVVVVGDKRTPIDWKLKGVDYLSPQDQKKLGFRLFKKLPWNNYARKNIGYLYAIKNKADIIADTDDDNFPLLNWGMLPNKRRYKVYCGSGFLNVYRNYTKNNVWPRGFPLQKILSKEEKFVQNLSHRNVEIWQFLVDRDPDVDAIYRLAINKMIYFKNKGDFVVLDKGVFCPFNSQNTFFKKESFLLMYLPSFVTMRSTDIFRGLIAQPIMWSDNMFLGFGGSTAYQERNPHDYFNDFISEIPVYTSSFDIAIESEKAVSYKRGLDKNLLFVYSVLVKKRFIPPEELALVSSWVEDVLSLI